MLKALLKPQIKSKYILFLKGTPCSLYVRRIVKKNPGYFTVRLTVRGWGALWARRPDN